MQKNPVKDDNEQIHGYSLKEILEQTLENTKFQSLKISEIFKHLSKKVSFGGSFG